MMIPMNGSRILAVAAGLVVQLSACKTVPSDSPSPYGTEWQLVELNGHPAPGGAGGKPATLTLVLDDGRASGFAGCNRFSGTFTTSANQIQFGPLMMTKMACSEGMDLEARYPAVLSGSNGFRVTATGLELLSGQEVVARFRRL
jgi:putative lipoprotein